MSPPLVSILMPARDAQGFVAEAIESVRSQTVGEWELLIVDDASRDNTAAICRRAATADSRIRLIQNDASPLGPGAARNRALHNARGGYIAVLDADDGWAPERLELLLDAIQPGTFVTDRIVPCATRQGKLLPLRSVGQRRESRRISLAEYVSRRDLLIKPLFPAAWLQEYALRYDESGRFGEDTLFHIALFRTGAEMIELGEAAYLYRLSPNALSTRPSRAMEMSEIFLDLARDAETSQLKRIFSAQSRRLEREGRYIAWLHDWRLNGAVALPRLLCRPSLWLECLKRIPGSLLRRLKVASQGGTLRG